MSAAGVPLDQRVDDHLLNLTLGLQDTQGLMRHILDSLGALKVRLENDKVIPSPYVNVFGAAVKCMADHITGFEPFDSQSAIGQLVSSFPDPLKR